MDFIIIGGGMAGRHLATDLGHAGFSGVLIEHGEFGGACINVACIPSKTLIRCARLAHDIRFGATRGVHGSDVCIDMPQIMAHIAQTTARIREGSQCALQGSGTQLVFAEGRLRSPSEVEAILPNGSTQCYTAPRIFINTGTRAALPDIPGLRAAQAMTHVEAFALQRVPEHLLILGAGISGLEFAQAFRRLGARVTLLEHGPSILPHDEPECAASITRILEDEGIRILTQATLEQVQGKSGEKLHAHGHAAGEPFDISASDLLVCTGRVAQTKGIGLEQVGVALDKAGYIKVDAHLQTSVPGVYALGDLCGHPMSSHAAVDDARIALSLFTGPARSTEGRLLPSVLFVDPEYGRVGLTEQAAKEAGYRIAVASLPAAAVARMHAEGQLQGLMKAVIDADSSRILGFAMVGFHAGETVSVVQAAMLAGQPYTLLRDAILAHPTASEGLNALFSAPLA
ncbi:dihydrolipoyl dehydrogenase family protein [Crenobacter intestini]|uniref:dihydrolipoyl dehydrogenase family protein n=1 Tax=Crenobacter intestini TaxID=2563443 RepID=UPI0014589B39|nr:FAD-dependent oxidoreductase [Crenobacter intestini]